MSHAQAFHTSCRIGLGGTSGFQISAATPSLAPEQLAAMSIAHARYETAPDAPYEPTTEQMAAFPVALRMSVVQGVGPVVSRTAYVGREYRGRDATPDEGRFGNYFCHMVVGGSESDPFDGLLAVELWGAPHWTTTDATDTALTALGPLTPGQVDFAAALAAVLAAPEGVGAALVDAALKAIDGGAPLLIVDPVADRAAIWIAWIAYALPAHVARTLTFSTYEGRPQDILNLHVVATLPACDNGATANSRFTRVDVTEPPHENGTRSLYARAVAVLAQQGPEALAGAVRMVRVDGAERQGATLVIAGGLTELVTDADLPAVLEELLVMVRGGRTAAAAEAAAALTASEAGDRAAIELWVRLYIEARKSTAGDGARDLATTALSRLVAHREHLPDPFPVIPDHTPASPGVGGIGAWLRATEAAKGTTASGGLVKQGVHLRLIGLNVPVDNRIGVVIAHDLERPEMLAALDDLDADGTIDHLIKEVADAVAAEPQATRRSRLLLLARYEMAQQTIRRRAEELGTFDAKADWHALRVALDPRARPDAALALAAIAVDARDEADIRELWGPGGPRTEDELNELLRAYVDAGRAVPEADSDRGFRMLMEAPLPLSPPERTSIGLTLSKLPRETCMRADFHAWAAAFERPDGRRAMRKAWPDAAIDALVDDHGLLPDERWYELLDAVGDGLSRERHSPQFAETLQRFETTEFIDVCEAIGKAMAAELDSASDRAEFAAREFDHWIRVPIRDIVDLVLPEAFDKLSEKHVEEVGQLVTPQAAFRWAAWTERHPRTGARAAAARLFGRRRGKDKAKGGGGR